MQRNSYILLLVLGLCAVLQPVSAQRRLFVDSRQTARLAHAHPVYFTRYNAPKSRDTKGLFSSEYAGTRHAVGGYVEGAYSRMFSSQPVPDGGIRGYGLGVGAIYEYHYRHLIFQTGLGLAWQDVHLSGWDHAYTNYDLATLGTTDPRWNSLQDSYGTTIDTLHYAFANRHDRALMLHAQIPLLVGGTTGGFYGLAGVKLNMAIAYSTRMDLDATSTAVYNRFIGTYEQMDNHGYRDQVHLSQKAGAMTRRFDILASAEMGYEFHRDKLWRFRLAAFADFGLLNISNDGNQPAIFVPFETKYTFPTFAMQPSLCSTDYTDNHLHNFFAGIKFTFLYVFPEKEKCILCGKVGKSLR